MPLDDFKRIVAYLKTDYFDLASEVGDHLYIREAPSSTIAAWNASRLDLRLQSYPANTSYCPFLFFELDDD